MNKPGNKVNTVETKVGVGESKHTNPFKAGAEAARTALRNAGMNTCDFVLLFATADYDHEVLLKGVRSVTGNTPLSGCSAAGIITQSGPSGEGYYTESGLVKGESTAGLMVFSSDNIRFQNEIVHRLKENSKKAGEKIGKTICSQSENPALLVMFPDGLSVNSNALFSGIESNIAKPVLFSGGAASESLNSNKTFQFHNDRVFTNSVSYTIISGAVNIETAISHGCYPISTEKTITKAMANRIYEIDNESAWTFFKSYLPEEVEELTSELSGSLCLCEKLPAELQSIYDTYIIHSPVVKYPDGSLLILSEIAPGSKIKLGRRDPDKISLNAKKWPKESNPGLETGSRLLYCTLIVSEEGNYVLAQKQKPWALM
jgi:hypothetical protein